MFLTALDSARAGNVNARSASETDVLTAVTLAKDGDTVVIPAGTARWSSQFTLTKAITISGAGIGKTIIYNDRVGGTFFQITTVPGKHTRVTGIEFQNGSGNNGGIITHGNFNILGPIKPGGGDFRLDNCKIYGFKGGPVIHTQTALGVVDHCYISSADGTIGYTYDDSFGGYTNGDGSWAAPSDYGGFNYAVYYEDCVFEMLSGSAAVFFDGTHGGRAVVRHCYFKGGFKAVVSHHGTESRNRSFRHFEWYDCVIENFASQTPLNQRGGTGVVFNNRFIGGPNGVDVALLLTTDRPVDPTYWGRASGKNPWDDNASGGPFYSGTCASGTTATRIVDNSANWSPNQWVGYAVTNTTLPFNKAGSSGQASGADLSIGSVIEANDAHSLTLAPQIFGTGNLAFAAGQSFKVYKAKNQLDLTGRAGVSMASLLTSNPATLNSTRQPGNNQISEPWYAWGNVLLKTDRKTVVKTQIAFRGNVSSIRPCTGSNNDECHYWNNNQPKPGYPWDSSKTALIGPDPSMGAFTVTGTGDTTVQSPHPLVSGSPLPTPTPAPTTTPTPAPTPTPNATPNPPTDLKVVPTP